MANSPCPVQCCGHVVFVRVFGEGGSTNLFLESGCSFFVHVLMNNLLLSLMMYAALHNTRRNNLSNVYHIADKTLIGQPFPAGPLWMATGHARKLKRDVDHSDSFHFHLANGR